VRGLGELGRGTRWCCCPGPGGSEAGRPLEGARGGGRLGLVAGGIGQHVIGDVIVALVVARPLVQHHHRVLPLYLQVLVVRLRDARSGTVEEDPALALPSLTHKVLLSAC